MTPRVSVLMPVYNGGRYLREAIQSILVQTHADFELILVDDGSTDGSSDVAAELARVEPRIRVLRRERLGVAGALNEGLAACRAPLVARMDADDIALPRRLERQLAYLETHPDCVVVGGQADLIDEDGDPFGWISNPLGHAAILYQLRRSGCAISHTTAVFRASEVRAAGAYRARYLAEDVDLFLRLSERGRLANLPRHVAHYRKREDAVTARWSADIVNAERLRRAEAFLEPGGGRVRPFPWCPEPHGRALQIARLGLAVHAGFDATARKYARRLFQARPRSPRLWLQVVSRVARSYVRRVVSPPAAPEA